MRFTMLDLHVRHAGIDGDLPVINNSAATFSPMQRGRKKVPPQLGQQADAYERLIETLRPGRDNKTSRERNLSLRRPAGTHIYGGEKAVSGVSRIEQNNVVQRLQRGF